MDKLSLSLAIIAHNEAARIRTCLDSVADLCSEIVAVVNDCTDDTVAILESYGAKVFQETWHGHRDQKNIALDKATQPWVLCLDADEALSPELREELIRFIRENPADCNGACFPRKVWFLGRWIKHGEWYPDYSLRLIRNGKGRWGGSPEHDKMVLEGRPGKLHGDLHHYSNPDMNTQIAKINYFSDIFLRRELARKRRFHWWKPVFRPFWKFFRGYILRCGFLDGFPGFYIACLSSFATLVRHSRLYEYNTTPAIKEKFDREIDAGR